MIDREAWRACLLSKKSTVQDAVRCLDASGLQIVIVVGPGDKLFGTVTDGDIRRGLLRGIELSAPIDAIVQREPMVVPPGLEADAIRQIMNANKIHQLPVVDADHHIVSLHVWDELQTPARRPNTMVVMAGGRGSRLGVHTENCPKPLLPVGGKPMLEHILMRARDEGFYRFVLTIHYLGHMIEEYFGDGKQFGIEIDYLREPKPLGTGGALSLLDPRPREPIVVTNGDVLTDVRYGEILDFHMRQGAAALMAVRAHEWQHPFGVVRTRGMDIVGFEEKPVYRTHVNAGVYVIDPATLDALELGQHCDIPTLFERLQADGQRTIVYPMHEPWLDVGRPADLEAAREAHAAI
jgi:dTDP-glucose pyrophosphorylase